MDTSAADNGLSVYATDGMSAVRRTNATQSVRQLSESI